MAIVLFGGYMYRILTYAKGIQSDFRRIFTEKKEYFHSISFEGKILRKEFCENCDINKYVLAIQLSNISDIPNIFDKRFPPYYSFETDSTLCISIPKEIFAKTHENMKIIKRQNTDTITIDGKDYKYLNNKEYNWLP